jgi:hypothetical protein
MQKCAVSDSTDRLSEFVHRILATPPRPSLHPTLAVSMPCTAQPAHQVELSTFYKCGSASFPVSQSRPVTFSALVPGSVAEPLQPDTTTIIESATCSLQSICSSCSIHVHTDVTNSCLSSEQRPSRSTLGIITFIWRALNCPNSLLTDLGHHIAGEATW